MRLGLIFSLALNICPFIVHNGSSSLSAISSYFSHLAKESSNDFS